MIFKVGDKVRVRNSTLTYHTFFDLEGEIVKVDGENVGVVLPKHTMSNTVQDYTWIFTNASQRLELLDSAPTPSASNVRQEKPCQVCGRPNDIGVKVCWNCGNLPEFI